MLKVLVTPVKEDGVVAGDFTRTPKGMADELASVDAAEGETERAFVLAPGDALKIEAKSQQHMVFDKEQNVSRYETLKEKREREEAAEAKEKADKEAEEQAKKDEEEEKKKAEERKAGKKPEHAGAIPKPGTSSPTTGAPTGGSSTSSKPPVDSHQVKNEPSPAPGSVKK